MTILTTADLIKRYELLDAIDDPSTDELDEWRDIAEALMPSLIADLRASQADYAAVAHAAGIEHVPDQGPTWPGPVDAVVRAIEEGRRAEGELIDARLRHEADQAECERLREAVRLAAEDMTRLQAETVEMARARGEEIEMLRSALAWYADPKNHDTWHAEGHPDIESAVYDDDGDRARAALAPKTSGTGVQSVATTEAGGVLPARSHPAPPQGPEPGGTILAPKPDQGGGA